MKSIIIAPEQRCGTRNRRRWAERPGPQPTHGRCVVRAARTLRLARRRTVVAIRLVDLVGSLAYLRGTHACRHTSTRAHRVSSERVGQFHFAPWVQCSATAGHSDICLSYTSTRRCQTGITVRVVSSPCGQSGSHCYVRGALPIALGEVGRSTHAHVSALCVWC